MLAPLVFGKLGYDPVADFTPVAHVANVQFALSVNASHPAQNVQELMAWFKANPDQANYGTPAPRSLPHFFGVMLARGAKVDLVDVPYNGGGPLMTTLIGGQVASAIDTLGDRREGIGVSGGLRPRTRPRLRGDLWLTKARTPASVRAETAHQGPACAGPCGWRRNERLQAFGLMRKLSNDEEARAPLTYQVSLANIAVVCPLRESTCRRSSSLQKARSCCPPRCGVGSEWVRAPGSKCSKSRTG